MIRKSIGATGFILAWSICSMCGSAAENNPAAWWEFNQGNGKTALDRASSNKDAIAGNFSYVEGVRGGAIKCDGFTTRIVRKAADAPHLAGI